MPGAQTVLEDVLRRDANAGEANLLMARLATRLSDVEDAEAYYRRAILGRWAPTQAEPALPVRIELVEFLGRVGSKERLLAELSRSTSGRTIPSSSAG